jgi:hypothetical protein
VEPKGPPQAYKTYAIFAPHGTHFRRATCAEAGCRAYQLGWTTILEPTAHAAQIYYIRLQAGRRFRETRDDGGRIVFDFEPGQRCFGEHRIRLDRPEIYVVRQGDHRASIGSPRVHSRPEDWIDDMQNHSDMIRTRVQRG